MNIDMNDKALLETLNDAISLAMMVPARQANGVSEDLAYRGLCMHVMRNRVVGMVHAAQAAEAEKEKANLAEKRDTGGEA